MNPTQRELDIVKRANDLAWDEDIYDRALMLPPRVLWLGGWYRQRKIRAQICV